MQAETQMVDGYSAVIVSEAKAVLVSQAKEQKQQIQQLSEDLTEGSIQVHLFFLGSRLMMMG